jgi:hypothetical protein
MVATGPYGRGTAGAIPFHSRTNRKEIAVGKISNGLGVREFLRGPRGLIAGLMVGIGLSLVLRVGAQQPQPPPAGQQAAAPPVTRFQISVADPQKIFILDHQANVVYLFTTNNQGVWEATEGFAITPELDRLHRSSPIPKVNP